MRWHGFLCSCHLQNFVRSWWRDRVLKILVIQDPLQSFIKPTSFSHLFTWSDFLKSNLYFFVLVGASRSWVLHPFLGLDSFFTLASALTQSLSVGFLSWASKWILIPVSVILWKPKIDTRTGRKESFWKWERAASKSTISFDFFWFPIHSFHFPAHPHNHTHIWAASLPWRKICRDGRPHTPSDVERNV